MSLLLGYFWLGLVLALENRLYVKKKYVQVRGWFPILFLHVVPTQTPSSQTPLDFLWQEQKRPTKRHPGTMNFLLKVSSGANVVSPAGKPDGMPHRRTLLDHSCRKPEPFLGSSWGNNLTLSHPEAAFWTFSPPHHDWAPLALPPHLRAVPACSPLSFPSPPPPRSPAALQTEPRA